MRAARVFALAALLLAGVGATAPAVADDATPPAPTRWVTDPVGFLSPDARAGLDARLEAYQRASGHSILVWIGGSSDGRPLDDFATRTFAAWKVGRKGVDDGLVLFIFATDRKIAIEVGYGLEDRVTDALAHRVIDETMAPRLRDGDPDGAVNAALDALTTAIDGTAFRTGAVQPVAAPRRARGQVGFFVLGGIFLVLLVFNPRLAMYFLWSIAASGRRGSGGWDGGGGGGRWSGGGGRSGGGGARGGW